jgi:hypothetical protein
MDIMTVQQDTCPECGETAGRVYGKMGDSQGTKDEYVCDGCKITWPTEWSEAYKKLNGNH